MNQYCPILPAIALSVGLVATASSQAVERLTREEFIARRDAARELRAEHQSNNPESSEQAHPSENSILDRSTIISSGRNWTFVPKGAVFALPEKYNDRVNLAAGQGDYIQFAEFARKNRQWLQTYSVTLEQARGAAPIANEAREALVKAGRVVISVCRGGPISTPAPQVEGAITKN